MWRFSTTFVGIYRYLSIIFFRFLLFPFVFLLSVPKKDFIIPLDLAGFAANLSDNGCHLLLLYLCNNGRNGTKQQESI